MQCLIIFHTYTQDIVFSQPFCNGLVSFFSLKVLGAVNTWFIVCCVVDSDSFCYLHRGRALETNGASMLNLQKVNNSPTTFLHHTVGHLLSDVLAQGTTVNHRVESKVDLYFTDG